MAWTDERMDDLASRMDAGFERTDSDIRELRTEIGSLRAEMHAGFRDVRAEMHAGSRDLRDEIDALRTLTMRFGIAMIVGMLGVIATLVGVVATGGLTG